MRIVFAADMSFNYMDSFPGKTAAIAAMSEPAAIFAKADVGVVNLENILGNREEGVPIVKSGPNLISEEGFIAYVHAMNPTIVGLANNHAKDYGEAPLYHTMDMLHQAGYSCIGAGRNIDEAYRPAMVSKDGVQVAIIAVCENEFGIATEIEGGTAGYSLGRVTKVIYQAIANGHKPVVYFHGGNEGNPFPSPGKVELYRHFIDLGAEAVIAMHTHCPQGYEIYQGKPIVYSMGNFFFPVSGKKPKSWFCGYMSELDFCEDGVELIIHPYWFDHERIRMLDGEDRETFLRYIDEISAPIGNAQSLQSLFDSWCLIGSYVERLAQFKLEYIADGYQEEVKAMKNIFCCEAHNELVKNTFFMLFESRLEQAKQNVEYIKKLQNMETEWN